MRNHWLVLPALALACALAPPASAQTHYGPGVTDKEITLGQTMPYSGPASSYSTIGKAEAAFFQMINDHGGINGRKIKLISLDDGYSPPKTVEQMRQLVEEDHILADFGSLGTPTNSAIQKYMNGNKVPQLFVATGATKWGDPQHFPWTMGWQPTYQTEGHIFARYILEHEPNAKIAILYQNDDYGKDYVKGLKDGLGAKASALIVKEVTYETTDPTIDSQIVSLQSSGANVFYNVSIPKFAAQAIRKSYDIGWKPLQLLNSVSASVAATLKPAGIDKSIGIITLLYLKDPTDPQWQNNKGYEDWLAWMKKYYPEGDRSDVNNVYGYTVSQSMAQVLKQCGNNLTRENIMKQAANLHQTLPMLLPGVTVSTEPTQFFPIREMQLARFDGKIWKLFGNVI
ncbi:MAG TPA: ABC transporter substrate-binding protein, partial [Stellaceae bacterium]|nr:ABC transporter substrate-binding protein [Stellaceae bacterium]